MPPSPIGRTGRARPRTARAGAVLVAVLLGALAACSGQRPTFADGPDATLATSSTTAPPRPGTVLVTDWADAFCSSFRAWQSDAATAGDALADELADTTDPGAVRAALVGLLDHLATGTAALAEDVRQGTVPDVDDGRRLVEEFAARLDELAETFAGYRGQAEGIDVEDPDRFQADVDAVLDSMRAGQDRVAGSFEEIDRDFPDPQLQRALHRACADG